MRLDGNRLHFKEISKGYAAKALRVEVEKISANKSTIYLKMLIL
jgi:hypothetical protein